MRLFWTLNNISRLQSTNNSKPKLHSPPHNQPPVAASGVPPVRAGGTPVEHVSCCWVRWWERLLSYWQSVVRPHRGCYCHSGPSAVPISASCAMSTGGVKWQHAHNICSCESPTMKTHYGFITSPTRSAEQASLNSLYAPPWVAQQSSCNFFFSAVT